MQVDRNQCEKTVQTKLQTSSFLAAMACEESSHDKRKETMFSRSHVPVVPRLRSSNEMKKIRPFFLVGVEPLILSDSQY